MVGALQRVGVYSLPIGALSNDHTTSDFTQIYYLTVLEVTSPQLVSLGSLEVTGPQSVSLGTKGSAARVWEEPICLSRFSRPPAPDAYVSLPCFRHSPLLSC